MKKNPNLDELTRFLKKEKAVLAAYLFGSYAKNRPKPSSDLDLAFLTTYPKSTKKRFEQRMRLSGELSHVLGRNVDLIFLEESSDLLGYEVLKTGKLVYESNKDKHREAVAKIVMKYLDFQYIQKIMEQGLVRAIKQGR